MGLVILSRDGVLNQVMPQGVLRPEDWKPLPGSLEAIARLNHAGCRVAVTLDQPGLAEGLLDLDTLNAIHNHMHQMLSRVGGHVDAVFTCPHIPNAMCQCGPIHPDLYLSIADRFSLEINDVPVVSHDPRHLQAAEAVSAQVFWIGEPDQTLEQRFSCFQNLDQLVKHLLNQKA